MNCASCGQLFFGSHICGGLGNSYQQPYVTSSLTPNLDYLILTELQNITGLLYKLVEQRSDVADRAALAAHWNA